MTRNSLPVPKKRSFWNKSSSVTKLSGIAGASGAAAAVWKLVCEMLSDGVSVSEGIESAFLLAIFFLSATAAFISWKLSNEDDHRHEHELHLDYTGALLTLVRSVQNRLDLADEVFQKLFRVTVYSFDGSELVQCCSYVGGEPDNRSVVGRKIPVSKGLVGWVARNAQGFVSIVGDEDFEKRTRELIERYGYTRAEAEALKPDRRAWAAVPITNQDSEIAGVLFADSSGPDFFAELVRIEMISAAEAIAELARRKYGN